jgi:hypothetical protein
MECLDVEPGTQTLLGALAQRENLELTDLV